MAKKTFETDKIIKSIPLEQLAALHSVRGLKNFKYFVQLINSIIMNDKDKQVGLVSDVASVDAAIEQATKQNFYRGGINRLVLLHSLMINAEKEITRREQVGKS